MRESTIHQSLNRRKLIMGVGDKAFMLEVGLGVILMNLQAWLLMPVIVGLHMLFRWLYAKDDIAINAYLAYMREADVYDPWARPAVVDARPEGFGRGLKC